MGAIWAIGEICVRWPADQTDPRVGKPGGHRWRPARAGRVAVVARWVTDAAAATAIAAHRPGRAAVSGGGRPGRMPPVSPLRGGADGSDSTPDVVLVGATPDGKDVAGALVGLTDLPVLVAAERPRSIDGVGHRRR